MNKNTINLPSLDDVLYQFSLEQDAPSAELLEEFTHHYPEYAEALTDFAIKWAVDAVAVPNINGKEGLDQDDDSVSIAMSRFLNKAHEFKSSKSTQASDGPHVPHNPFSELGKKEFCDLAQRLNVTRVFLSKVRDRIIEVSTVRPGFFDLLAKEIGLSSGMVRAHFTVDAELHPEIKFKATSKPSVQNKQSYEDAIESSALSSEQKSILRNI